MKILLVEDGQEKRQAIAEVVASAHSDCVLRLAVNVADAKRMLSAERFDLMLLDINLPRTSNGPPEADGGLEVLRWLRGRGRASRPTYIVGITAFEDSLQKAKAEFDNLLWRVEPIKVGDNEWRGALAKTLVDLDAQIRPPYRGDGKTFRTDVLVVAALPDPELDAILQLPADFQRVDVEGDSSVYYRGRLTRGRRAVHVVAVAASDKGLSGAAIAAMKGIMSFWPRYVYMPGITAGVKGRTKIGDVIFADLSWDWGSGKLKTIKGREEFLPAPYQRRLDETLSVAAKTLHKDEHLIEPLWQAWSGERPDETPRVLVGAMASGASVLQSRQAVKRVLSQHKDLLAIEMEAFSLMFSCETAPQPRPKGIVAKSVCDNGDGKKNDKYQKFAAACSAFVFHEYALKYLSQEDME